MKLNFVLIVIILLILLLIIIVLLTKHNSKFIGSNVTDSRAGANQNRARILFKYTNPTTFGNNGAVWNGLILYLKEVSNITPELRDSQPPLTEIFGANNIFFNERYSNYYTTYTTNSDLRNKRPNIIKNESSINTLYSTLKDNNLIDDYTDDTVTVFATGISTTQSLKSIIPDNTLRNQLSQYMANLVLFSSLFKNTQIGIYDEYTDEEYSTPISFSNTIAIGSDTSKLRKNSQTVYIGTKSAKYVTLDTNVPYYKFGIAIINDKSTIQTPDYSTFPFTISNFYSIIIPANVAGFYSDPISGLSAMIDFF